VPDNRSHELAVRLVTRLLAYSNPMYLSISLRTLRLKSDARERNARSVAQVQYYFINRVDVCMVQLLIVYLTVALLSRVTESIVAGVTVSLVLTLMRLCNRLDKNRLKNGRLCDSKAQNSKQISCKLLKHSVKIYTSGVTRE